MTGRDDKQKWYRGKAKKEENLSGLTRREIRAKQRRQEVHMQIAMLCAGAAIIVLVILLVFFVRNRPAKVSNENVESQSEDAEGRAAQDAADDAAAQAWKQYDIGSPVKETPCPALDVQLLTINEYSRPGLPTDGIAGIVVHYTANPGSTAQQNRDYFENLKDTQETKVSSNFVVGLDGEIVQCIPTDEVAYASNERNNDTVSIECCHPDETGKFNDNTYQSLVELVAFLCGKFNVTPDAVIRHYDVTGKDCPKYFVEHEAAWYQFKADVADYIAQNGN